MGELPGRSLLSAELGVEGVRAFTTLRTGGVSRPPFASWNMGQHTGDDARAVSENRRRLQVLLGVDTAPLWLNQVHGTTVVAAHEAAIGVEADAAWTDRPGLPCVVMTADCLPVIMASRRADCVAVAHAGWRGLAAGVIENTLASLPVAAEELSVWLGPAIGSGAFEVGEDVREAFFRSLGAARAEGCFISLGQDKFSADLAGLARIILLDHGVRRITGGDCCTYADPGRFYSHRRDRNTGRMASVVLIEP